MIISSLRRELQLAEAMSQIAWALNDIKVDQYTHHQLKRSIKALQTKYKKEVARGSGLL